MDVTCVLIIWFVHHVGKSSGSNDYQYNTTAVKEFKIVKKQSNQSGPAKENDGRHYGQPPVGSMGQSSPLSYGQSFTNQPAIIPPRSQFARTKPKFGFTSPPELMIPTRNNIELGDQNEEVVTPAPEIPIPLNHNGESNFGKPDIPLPKTEGNLVDSAYSTEPSMLHGNNKYEVSHSKTDLGLPPEYAAHSATSKHEKSQYDSESKVVKFDKHSSVLKSGPPVDAPAFRNKLPHGSTEKTTKGTEHSVKNLPSYLPTNLPFNLSSNFPSNSHSNLSTNLPSNLLSNFSTNLPTNSTTDVSGSSKHSTPAHGKSTKEEHLPTKLISYNDGLEHFFRRDHQGTEHTGTGSNNGSTDSEFK